MTEQLIRVGAIQIDSIPGQLQSNLDHATKFVERATESGAQLVLLPELMPSGYMLTEEIWDCAETGNGPTISWLTRLSKRFGIYLGTTFLETEGENFYNTFALATPQGEIAGRVRKSPPASLEAYFYCAGSDSHIIETELGRIGVGICYENLLYEHLRELCEEKIDLVLQPTAAGRPLPMKPGDIQLFDSMVRRISPRYARVLGVPVVLANRSGAICTPMPGDSGIFDSTFAGLSTIVDADGSVKARMGVEKEGSIVANVHLGTQKKPIQNPRCYGKMWALPMPWYAYIWPLTQAQGEEAYKENIRRKERALHLSKGKKQPEKD